MQKKAVDAVVTLGYGHSHECFLLHIEEELKEETL